MTSQKESTITTENSDSVITPDSSEGKLFVIVI